MKPSAVYWKREARPVTSRPAVKRPEIEVESKEFQASNRTKSATSSSLPPSEPCHHHHEGKLAKTSAKTSMVKLKDLCPADKLRIKALVEQLAQAGEERDRAAVELTAERLQFRGLLSSLQQQHLQVLREKKELESELQTSPETHRNNVPLMEDIGNVRPRQSISNNGHSRSSHGTYQRVLNPDAFLAIPDTVAIQDPQADTTDVTYSTTNRPSDATYSTTNKSTAATYNKSTAATYSTTNRPSAATYSTTNRPTAATYSTTNRPSAATYSTTNRPSAATYSTTNRPSAATYSTTNRPTATTCAATNRPSAVTHAATNRPSRTPPMEDWTSLPPATPPPMDETSPKASFPEGSLPEENVQPAFPQGSSNQTFTGSLDEGLKAIGTQTDEFKSTSTQTIAEVDCPDSTLVWGNSPDERSSLFVLSGNAALKPATTSISTGIQTSLVQEEIITPKNTLSDNHQNPPVQSESLESNPMTSESHPATLESNPVTLESNPMTLESNPVMTSGAEGNGRVEPAELDMDGLLATALLNARDTVLTIHQALASRSKTRRGEDSSIQALASRSKTRRGEDSSIQTLAGRRREEDSHAAVVDEISTRKDPSAVDLEEDYEVGSVLNSEPPCDRNEAALSPMELAVSLNFTEVSLAEFLSNHDQGTVTTSTPTERCEGEKKCRGIIDKHSRLCQSGKSECVPVKFQTTGRTESESNDSDNIIEELFFI